VTAIKRIAFTLLAIAVIAATWATRQAVTRASGHVARGCQAAAPGGKVATIEADIATAVQHAASAPGTWTRAGRVLALATAACPERSAFEFARPHDPQHLHSFSLLI